MILIDSKRKKLENILKKHPDAIIADVTSHAEDDLIKLSPFYPHGGIPVPFSNGSRMEDSILGRIVRNVVSIFLNQEVEDLVLHPGRWISVIIWNIMFVSALP